jgi:glucan phosphoethanolaminetransferase (alkaline phosphatase superfamily)
MLRLTLLFCGVFLAYGALEDFSFFEMTRYQLSRRDLSNPVFNATVFTGSYLVAIFGLTLVYIHASRAVRYPAYLITAATVATFVGFKRVNGRGFGFHEASMTISAMEFIPDALRFFAWAYALPAILALVLAVAFDRFARSNLPRIRSWAVCFVPLVAFFMFFRITEATQAKIYHAPIPYRIPILLHRAHAHRMPHYSPRGEPRIVPRGEPLVDHIVFLVDESIRGDLLGVNGSRYDTTPFLNSVADRIFNYGVISSVSNLSDSANIVLQSGLRPDQFPDTELNSLKNANVFAYMQQAEFSSFLIDAQIYSDTPQNFLTGFDLEALDGYFQIKRLEAGRRLFDMDRAIVPLLQGIVAENVRSFTYVVKLGAHFPYDEHYPATARVFEPALEGVFVMDREKTLNSYLNAVRWSVDGFLEQLFHGFEDSPARILFVYTSDHGQSFMETRDATGAVERGGHGTTVDPPSSQATVPLMFFSFDDEVSERLRSLYDPSLVDRASAFELFATLLRIAGYSEEDIRTHHHHSVFDRDAVRGRRAFISGNLFGYGDSSRLNEYRPLPAPESS